MPPRPACLRLLVQDWGLDKAAHRKRSMLSRLGRPSGNPQPGHGHAAARPQALGILRENRRLTAGREKPRIAEDLQSSVERGRGKAEATQANRPETFIAAPGGSLWGDSFQQQSCPSHQRS